MANSNQNVVLEEDYNPYDHRRGPNLTTNLDTLMHLVKHAAGTLLLAMPSAFVKSGWLNGVVSSFVTSMFAAYCVHIFLKSQYKLCKRKKCPKLSYSDTVRSVITLGPERTRFLSAYIPALVNLLLIAYQFGGSCTYVIFLAENIKYVYSAHTDTNFPDEVFYSAIFVPLLLVNCAMKNLKVMAPLSLVANLLTFVGVAIIFYFLLMDPLPVTERAAVGDLSEYIRFLGMLLSSYDMISMVPTLENNMEKPKNMRGVLGILNVNMLILVILYSSMGFLGYMKYGDAVSSAITLDLPIKEYTLAKIAVILFIFAFFLSFSLQVYVPVEIILNTQQCQNFLDKNKYRTYCEYALRMVVVISIFITSYLIPHLKLFMALTGCLCITVLGLIFPAICDLVTSVYLRESRTHAYIFGTYAKNAVIIAIGLITLIIGTYCSFADIYRAIFLDETPN